jgi:alkylation response protein AidB-like acyl-CoA dehydrogenase
LPFLKTERDALAEFLPGLDEALAELPLLEMEKPGNPAINLFREMGGTGLLIPVKYKGLGATPLQVVRIQRAIASRAPSLAVATAMHHFSVATIVEMVEARLGSGFEWMLLEAVAQQKIYLSSGFAEGRTGANILTPSMQARRDAQGLIVSGSKKPCSLSASMGLLTASVLVPSKSGRGIELAVIIVPADTEGIERRPFWGNWALAGAESEEVILHEISVPEKLISYLGDPSELSALQASGFLWFEIIISASYLGMASALVERVIQRSSGIASERALLGIEVEGAMAALEGVACAMMSGRQDHDALARALFVRYTVQQAIERITVRAVELLGGMNFITSSESIYLLSAARALAFHPPSRLSMSPALDQYLAGEVLRL